LSSARELEIELQAEKRELVRRLAKRGVRRVEHEVRLGGAAGKV
jgi:hypothetical protein